MARVFGAGIGVRKAVASWNGSMMPHTTIATIVR
jgi:hypothetical protein